MWEHSTYRGQLGDRGNRYKIVYFLPIIFAKFTLITLRPDLYTLYNPDYCKICALITYKVNVIIRIYIKLESFSCLLTPSMYFVN